MPYDRLEITPIIEESDFSDKNNIVCKADIHFNLWDKSHLNGQITYISSKKLGGELFTYGELKSFFDCLDEDEKKDIHNEIRSEIMKEVEIDTLVPLKQFYCDKCGEIIEPDKAVIQFEIRLSGASKRFQIVHFDKCEYSYEDMRNFGSYARYMVSSDRDDLASLIALWEMSEESGRDEIIEMIKRTQLPYYEEARLRKDKIEKVAESLDWPQYKYFRKNLRTVVKTSDKEFQEQDKKIEETLKMLREKGMLADDNFLV